MALSYDQMYLSDVQKNLGFLFQFCLCNLEKSPEELQQDIGQLPSYVRGRYQQDGGFDTIRDEPVVCFQPIPQ